MPNKIGIWHTEILFENISELKADLLQSRVR
jgi:hypothetical protein